MINDYTHEYWIGNMNKSTPGLTPTEIGKPHGEPNLESRGPGFLVRRLQQVSVSIFLEHLELLGLTPLQATVLRILGREEGIDQLSLASRAKVDTSTIKDVVQRLEANLAVTRSRSEVDRRMQLVYLTARGRQLLDDSTPAAIEAAQRLLAPLTESEKEQFLTTMRKLVGAHEEPTEPGRRTAWRRRRVNR
jgi:DNA-binding MarR family transcriptional regulator